MDFRLDDLIDLEDIPKWFGENPAITYSLLGFLAVMVAATIFSVGFRNGFKAFMGSVDRNLEKVIMLFNYILMTIIIFVEVFRRFLFAEQAPWSTTIPIYLFLWVVWIGCAYNVRIRTHLRFDEIRSRMPYAAQFACLMFDSLLWIGFACIVLYFTTDQVIMLRDNFAIVQGTDEVLLWWFYTATPIAFVLLIFRVLQNVYEDVTKFSRGEPLQVQTSVLGE